MVRNAEQTATSAESSQTNPVGMCLQWSRERATIGALQPDAATAWKHAHNRHPGDKNPPRGAMVYWTGGSKGYGHIAVSLGGGKIRSSDANGNGTPATVSIDWPTQKWGMPYAGWADNVNDQVIPGVVPAPVSEDPMPQYDHASCSTSVKVPADTWVAIPWSKAISGKAFKAGSKTAALAGRTYSAVVNATFDAPTGCTIRIRTVEVASGETEESNPQSEFVATSGKSYAQHAQSGAVAKGRAWAVRVSSDRDVTLLAADAVVLSW